MGGTYYQHDNPYINQLANLPYEMGPARKYYKDYLKADKNGTMGNMGFNRYFDAEAAKQNSAVDAQYDPLAFAQASAAGGPAGLSYKNNLKAANNQANNQERYRYGQNQAQGAAQGLQQMFAAKNQFTSNNLATAGGLENQRYNFVQTPSFFQTYAQLLSGAANGAQAGAGAG